MKNLIHWITLQSLFLMVVIPSYSLARQPTESLSYEETTVPPPSTDLNLPDFDSSSSRAIDELINAELCVASIGLILALGKILASSGPNLALIEKAVKAGKTTEEKIAILTANFLKYFKVNLGPETAKWIVSKLAATTEVLGLFNILKLLIRTCADGIEGIGRAIKDGVVVGGALIQGNDPVTFKKACAMGTFPADGPQCTAIACWEDASRGLYCSKRCDAHKCCAGKFSEGNDRKTCDNFVNNIADDSGW